MKAILAYRTPRRNFLKTLTGQVYYNSEHLFMLATSYTFKEYNTPKK